MPRNSFPASSRYINKPILVTGVDPAWQADDGSTSGQTGSPLAIREQTPWRLVGASLASLGIPVGIGVLHPVLGEVIAVIAVVVMLTVICTAMFGSAELSERAFRLLRWIGNRPEPPGPRPARASRRQ